MLLRDLSNPHDDQPSKRTQANKRKFNEDRLAWGLNWFFDQFPETVLLDRIKPIIANHIAKMSLDEVCTVKGRMGIEAQLNLGVIIPFALYWLYRNALHMPDTEPLAIHQVKALKTALRCLDTYLPQLIKRTELNLNRTMAEAMLHAFNVDPAFRRIPQKWQKSIERRYRISLKRGHPLTRELAARKALEMKTDNPKFSWMQIAQRVCHCEKRAHDWSCRENLRQGVIILKKKMKNGGVF
jgi:hypothetical protein